MLVLSRSIGESIVIGDQVKITVLAISGLQVKLGVEAPREISVHRLEVYKRIINVQPADVERDKVVKRVYGRKRSISSE